MTQTTLREYLRKTEDAIGSGRYEEAMTNCQNILAYFPEALEAQRLLGEVYLAQNRLEEAQQTFEWILTNDPENVIVYCDRALISERTSDIDTALDCYQQAYELSRGSANIRQAFNNLSTGAGQQEFMFSRAGLARLYMRGDLLTQAIQEWEAVLAISPERLDARLGLMETYWRDGLYDKAEQIATRLLEEIPTCLKALLYLAHIASISNIQRARALLERAETLDPELHVAQEIFADLAASSPTDPFLGLIKKDPILLENGKPINQKPASIPAPVAQVQASAPVPSGAAAAVNYNGWESSDSWDKKSSASLSQPVPETPTRSSWEQETMALNQSETSMAAWQAQLEQTAAPTEQQWYDEGQFAQTNSSALPQWEKLENTQNGLDGWSNDLQANDQTSPPAWLDTLTISEQNKAEEPSSPTQEPTPLAVREERAAFTPALEPTTPANEAMPFFFSSEDDSEEETSWPDWLKSLGAESLEPEPTPSAELPPIEAFAPPPTPQAQPQSREISQSVEQKQPDIESDPWAALPSMSTTIDEPVETYSQPEWVQQFSPVEYSPAQSAPAATPDWMQHFASSPEPDVSQNSTPNWIQQLADPSTQDIVQNGTSDWMQQFANPEPPFQQGNTTSAQATQEERYLASLEDLEKNLQSQGFVPLTPGALASLAQNQPEVSMPPYGTGPLPPTMAPSGNIAQPALPADDSSSPWWNAMMPPASEQISLNASYVTNETMNPFAALGAKTSEEASQQPSALPATPRPLPPPQPFEPAESAQSPTGVPLTPTYRSDALLDSDLETTMKRPAIKLQRMPTSSTNTDRSFAHTRSVSQSDINSIEHTDDANLNSHERLVRGYQYQLAGSYDDAMQEYRLIIRNAPELLDDVISNMRAMLKFNPRFSLGYRVLGDAYMRKGEYLQAMESYNKALTMAKKAKN